MGRTTRTVAVGPEGYRAVCPLPREGIGFWEGIALSCRGWLDARRNRDVRDGDHTHSAHRLLHRYRMGEATAVQRIDEALSAVDRAIAPLEAVAVAPELPVAASPSVSDLAELADDARAEWADRVRAAQRAQAASAAAEARRARAREELPVLLSIRDGLVVEGNGVRRHWAEAYAVRAARYTRARFGRRGGVIAERPEVPAWRPGADPTPGRRAV